MPVAVFDYAGFIAGYGEFSAVPEATLAANFLKAGLYHNNTACTPIADAAQQLALMNLVTAHITARYSQSAGSPNPGSPQDANSPVGRLASAGEGSVSASFQNDYPPGTAQWWQQTKYGSDYWAATIAYRSARYRARPTVVVPGVAYGRGYGYGYGPYGGGNGYQ